MDIEHSPATDARTFSPGRSVRLHADLCTTTIDDFRALALECVGPFLDGGKAGLRLAGIAKSQRHARHLEQRTNLIVRQLREDEHFYTGKVGGQLAAEFPMPVTNEVMARGQERFNVFCAPCHSRTGEGTGMIVQRGFRQPPSYYEERLVNAPVGYLFDVMTNGFGAMQDYAAQVPPADRWAIAAYIRALQFSRRGTTVDVPADRREELDRSPVTPAPPPPPGGASTPGAPAPQAPAAPQAQRPQENR